MKKISYLFICQLVFLGMLICHSTFAAESLSYSGRLVNANGSPVSGYVNLKIDLSYTTASPATILCSQSFSNVALSNGVFHLKLDLNCGANSLTDTLLSIPSGLVPTLRVTDVTHDKIYSFQALHSMPFANISEKAKQLVQLNATDGQVLKWSNDLKKWVPGTALSSGTVTSVSANAPLAISNASTTPALSISQADTNTSGYLSAADWNMFNTKQSITAGLSNQYYRGDKTWQTLDTSAVAENAIRLYFTNARALGVPLDGFAVSSGTIIATDTVLAAFGKTQGQINSLLSDSEKFLIKNGNDSVTGVVNVGTIGLLQLAYEPIGQNDAANKAYVDTKLDLSGGSLTGDLALDTQIKLKNGGAANYITLKASAAGTTAYTLSLPTTAGSANQYLMTDGAGVTSWTSLTSSATPSGAAAGDLSGSYPNPTINNLAATKISSGTVDNTEFNYLDGVTNSIQTQLNAREGTITATTTDKIFRGDKTFVVLDTSIVPENTNLYFTEARAQAALVDGLALKLNKTGGILSVGTISGVPTPNNSDDVVNKGYVDNFGQWTKSVNDIYLASGKVGIGVAIPQSKLDIDGSVKVGIDATVCSPAIAGAIRFSTPNIEYCNGTDWKTVTEASSVQAKLDAKEASIAVGSNAQYIKGDKSLGTFASDLLGTLLNGLTTAANEIISTGDSVLGAFGKLQKQITDLGTSKLNKTGGVLSVGTISGVPTPSNDDDVANKAYVDKVGVVIHALTDAPTISVDASLGNVFSVTLAGNRTLANPTNLINGHTYVFRIMQDSSGGRTLGWGTNFIFSGNSIPSTVANVLSIATFVSDGTKLYNTGGYNLSGIIPFNFTNLTGVATGAIATSSAIVVSGVSGAILASVTGSGNPALSINGGAWGATATVQNGDSLRVQLTSSSSFSSAWSALITVGSYSTSWSVTTTTCSGTTTLAYSGAIVNFTVPASCNTLTIETWGAKGGTGISYTGGLGAYIKGTIATAPGTVYKVLVGQKGGDNASYAAGGGGGGTFVTNSSNSPIMIAGGGGGGGGNSFPAIGQAGLTSTSGGSQGGGTGGSAGAGGGTSAGSNGAGGLTSNGTLSSCAAANYSTAYSFTNGGAGSSGGNCAAGGGYGGFGGGSGGEWCCQGVPGSGGGYSGGSGLGNSAPAGGAGGGSYASGTSQVLTSGVDAGVAGNGKVIFTYGP